MSEVIASPSYPLQQWYEAMGPPKAVPRYGHRLRLIRAGLGLLCLLSMAGAFISLVVLVVWASRLAGLSLGVSLLLFWSALRLGDKFSPREPQRNWGTVVLRRSD